MRRSRAGRATRTRQGDLLQLVAALRQSWERIEGRTCVERSELDEAEADANELMTRAGILARQGASAEAADLRARAFSLMASTYDEVRRLVAYLRWHEGDAERIAPSFVGRPRGKRRARVDVASGEGDTPAAT